MPPRFRSILLASLCSSLVMTLLNVGSLSFMQQVVDGDGLGLAPFAVLACCVGCLAPLAAALLAIWHYTREYDLSLSSGQGMIVGLWTGLAHALLTALMAAANSALPKSSRPHPSPSHPAAPHRHHRGRPAPGKYPLANSRLRPPRYVLARRP